MKTRICSILLMLACAFACRAEKAANGLLLKVSFDKGLQAADYASGSPVPISCDGAEIVPDGKKGQGYIQKKPGSLKFASQGNVNPREGTVAMWIKPVNWSGDERKFRYFFSIGEMRDGQSCVQLYKYCNSAMLLLLARRPGVEGDYQLYDPQYFPTWKAGEWHHLAFSWSKADQQCILYCDGKPTRGGFNNAYFPDKPEDVISGISFNNLSSGTQCDPTQLTVMDEIHVFDHAIGARGVQELMQSETKSAVPQFTMPFIHKTPKIDGVTQPGEYDEFFSTNTFIEYGKMGFFPRESQVYTGYDDKNLYVCFKTRTKGGDQNIEILAQRQERDSDVWLDDAVELLFAPPGEGLTQIVVNSIGTLYDIKNGMTGFNGNYEIANLIEGIWWVCEIRIPFAELGYKPFSAGDQWKIHFTRDWKNPLTFVSLADTSSFSNIVEMPDWTWGDDQGTAALRLDMDAIQSQQVKLSGTVMSKTAALSPYTLEVYAISTDGSAVPLATQAVPAVPDQQKIFELEYQASNLDSTKFQNKIGVMLKRGDGIVLQDATYVLRSYPPMALSASILSKRKEFLCTADISGLPQMLPEVKLDFIFKENGAVVKEQSFSQLSGRVVRTAYAPSKWSTQTQCTLLVRASNVKNDVVLLEKELEFTVPETEAWQNSTAGIDHTVPPPWTPLERNGTTVTVWNRAYSLQDDALLSQVTSAGAELLAKGVELFLVDGNGQRVRLNGLQFSKEIYPDAVTFTAQADAMDFSSKISGRIEFDGFCWYELAITPKKEVATLDSLALEFSVPEAQVDFVQVNPFGTGYADLYSQETKSGSYPFIRQIMFGNDKRAIAFFMESDEFFYPENRKDVFKNFLQGDIRTVRVDMVQEPVVITGERKYGFGFSVAPLKPLPEKWQNLIQSYRGKFNKECSLIQIWSWSRWYGFMRPISEKEFHQNLNNLTRLYPQAKMQPYLCQYILSTLSPEYKLYSEEWASLPLQEIMEFGPRYPGKSICACLGADAYRSFWVDSFAKFIEEYPQVNGCYWDSIDPVSCENELHGHGYTDSKGKRKPTNDILHYRDFYKRNYKLLKAKHPDAIITGHSSARRHLPTISFCDVVYDGEQFVSNVSGNPNYCFTLNDMYCRAFFGTQFGLVPMLLPAYYNNEKKVASVKEPTESIYLHSLIYNFIVHSHRVNDDVTDEILAITRPFDLGASEYFGPHDQRTDELVPVTLPPGADVRKAIYRKPDGRKMIILGNFGAQKITAAIGAFKTDPVTEKRTGSILSLKEGVFQVDIPAYNFVILE